MYAANFFPAIIFTKEGEKIECLVKFPEIKDKKISYKLSQKSQVVKIPSESTERIVFINKTDDSYGEIVYTSYHYYDLLGTRLHKPHWLGVVVKGEVTLLMYIEGSARHCICKRSKEDFPTYLGAYQVGASFSIANPFYKKAEEYFSDYPELAQKIKNKEYKDRDIKNIVTEYNVWKSVK